MPDVPRYNKVTSPPVNFLKKDGPWVWREEVTLGENSSGGPSTDGALPQGRAIGIKTADGKAYDYNDNASDGTETCVGILDNEGGADVSGGDKQGTIVKGFCIFIEANLSGIDANGKTDLGSNGAFFA